MLTMLLIAATTTPYHPSVVVNGDFKAGNTGFKSDYVFTTSDLSPTGVYAVVQDPHTDHPGGASFCGPHGPATFMLAANGSESPHQALWQQTVSVKPHRTYYFGLHGASWGEGGDLIGDQTTDPSPARLVVFVNGMPIGNPFQFERRDGAWAKFTAPWNSGTAERAVLRIEDVNTDGFGNDFAVADIVFHD